MYRTSLIAFSVLTICCGASGSAQSKENFVVIPQGSSNQNLRRAPGKLIAEGHNTVRVGPDELLTYRLEEVELPQPMDLEIHGLKERLNTVMRLTITSAKAVDGNRIWIND